IDLVDAAVAVGVAKEAEETIVGAARITELAVADHRIVPAGDRVVNAVERAAGADDLRSVDGEVPVTIVERAKGGQTAGEAIERHDVARALSGCEGDIAGDSTGAVPEQREGIAD